MKKFMMVLSMSLLVLAACSSKTDKTEESSSSSSSQTSTSTAVAQKQTKSFQITQKEQEQTQTTTITTTYQGDQFLKVIFDVHQPLPAATKQAFAGQDLNEWKPTVLAELDQTEEIKKLKSVEGMDVQTDILDNYDFRIRIQVDFEKVDLAEASKVPNFNAFFAGLETLTPEQYFEAFKANEAKEVPNPSDIKE